MANCNTILSQILRFVSRHEFESLANRHHSGRAFHTATRWSQFATMVMVQLSGRISLRDIVENMSVQAHRPYHFGSAKLTRSDLARMNENKPIICMRHYLGNCYSSANTWHLAISSASRMSFTRWMPLRLICACLFFRGLTFDLQKGRSSCMLASITVAICLSLQ